MSSSSASRPRDGKERAPRPFVGVVFLCCRAYGRLYLRADGAAFEGRCPRCGRRACLRVDPGGSTSRFFELG